MRILNLLAQIHKSDGIAGKYRKPSLWKRKWTFVPAQTGLQSTVNMTCVLAHGNSMLLLQKHEE